LIGLLILLTAGCLGCNSEDEVIIEHLDLNDTVDINLPESDENRQPFRIAIAAMISPRETFTYYEELLHHISQAIDRPVRLEQRKTYKEVNELIEARQIDMAFICSGAYVDARESFPVEILAIPVIQGADTYRAYIIVNKNSNIDTFEELRNKKFAFTDRLSNSGYLHGLKRLSNLNETPDSFFGDYMFSSGHDYSIMAVAGGIVDGATVDGLIFEYYKVRFPSRVENIKVIEISEEYGMPPIVVHRDVSQTTKDELRRILLTLHQTDDGAALLKPLMIDRFQEGRESDYDTIRLIQ